MNEAPIPQPPRSASFGLVSLCFFLSGTAGLIYQMVWMRMLSTVFGTSELAIVAVLVAYMGGLASGAWAASKWLHRLRRPIVAYAVLELTIALSAIAVPLLLELAGELRVALLGGQTQLPADGGFLEALSHLALGCLVLFVPTACMGATLPILAKGLVHRPAQIGGRIGWLYALNTFGAVAGTVAAAFWLIPSLGLWGASFCAVGLNVLVAVLGWGAARGTVTIATGGTTGGHGDPSPPVVRRTAILGVMLVSGALAFVYEVLWARLLAHMLGGSLFSFATMLAAFLTGIATGGLIGARLARHRRGSGYWLAGCEVGAGVLTAIVLAIVSGDGFGGTGGSLFGQAMVCVLVLTPATICLGATFPLAVRCLSDGAQDAGPAVGRVYAWNTSGAIAGAVAAGLLIIPAIGYAETFRWAVTANLALAAVVLAALRPVPRAPLAVSVAGCLAAAIFYRPQPPVGLLTRSPVGENERAGKPPRLVHYATGRSATVSVLERRGSLVIRSNGLQEAEIFPRGAESLAYTAIRWLPALPKVLKRDATSLLVVGFGGGALLESVPAGFADIDVVEIEEEVIAANKLVAGRRAIDPLADRRLRIVINDARGALALSDKRYDAIVSQPSHPWTAGASHLYTREFLRIAANHMTRGGIFVQWLGSSFVDQPLLASFCAAALDVFPHVQLYLIGDNFVVVASDESLDDRLWAGGSLIELSGYPKLSYLEDLLAVLQLDEAGCAELAKGHPPITDDRNLMATHHLPGNDFAGALNEPQNLVAAIGPLHFLNRDPATVRAKLESAGVDLRYLTRLLQSGSPALDRQQFYTEVLTEGDRLLGKAATLLDSQPDAASGQLSSAALLGVSEARVRPLAALAGFNYAVASWSSRKTFPLPKEFGDFLAENPALGKIAGELHERESALLEAGYWSLTGQADRVSEVAPALAAFADHRRPWFEPAYQARLIALTAATGKTPEQEIEDARAATLLLDQLLALPLERNLPLVRLRISLAQKFGDHEFLRSLGWIIATKYQRIPPGAPEATKKAFASLLGSLFAPFVTGASGVPTFNEPGIGDLYRDLSEELGHGVIPLARPE